MHLILPVSWDSLPSAVRLLALVDTVGVIIELEE